MAGVMVPCVKKWGSFALGEAPAYSVAGTVTKGAVFIARRQNLT